MIDNDAVSDILFSLSCIYYPINNKEFPCYFIGAFVFLIVILQKNARMVMI